MLLLLILLENVLSFSSFSSFSSLCYLQATKAGVVAWKKRPGAWVKAGDLLGEIVDIEDPDAPRTPLAARNNGLLFCLARHKLVRYVRMYCSTGNWQ
jgi:predicted deacylase